MQCRCSSQLEQPDCHRGKRRPILRCTRFGADAYRDLLTTSTWERQIIVSKPEDFRPILPRLCRPAHPQSTSMLQTAPRGMRVLDISCTYVLFRDTFEYRPVQQFRTTAVCPLPPRPHRPSRNSQATCRIAWSMDALLPVNPQNPYRRQQNCPVYRRACAGGQILTARTEIV
jgi:hypothetical protein